MRKENEQDMMAVVNLKWQNQQKKRTSMLRKIVIATLALVIMATAIGVTAVAADEVELVSIPVTEVNSISNTDFMYTDPDICWGITYLPDTRSWVVETITGDYTIEYAIPTVDWTDPVRCVRN